MLLISPSDLPWWAWMLGAAAIGLIARLGRIVSAADAGEQEGVLDVG